MVIERSVSDLEARTERLLSKAGAVTTELRSHTDELQELLAELRAAVRARGEDSGLRQVVKEDGRDD